MSLWTCQCVKHYHILFLYYGKTLRALVALILLILLLWENTHSRYHYYPHFTDKATKAQNRKKLAPDWQHSFSHI